LKNLLSQSVPLSSDTLYTGWRVFILLACYNGARYVEEQIRSIQAQHFSDWVLIVRDDGSRDDTVEIIQRLTQEDARIHLLDDRIGNLGVSGNFSELMQYALMREADYVFFSDQDDIWNPDKLGVMLAAMREMEATEGNRLPLLVYSDLAVVDAQKKMIAPSFLKYVKRSPAHTNLGVLLAQCQVVGCACLVNRAALDLACPVPQGAWMHDWWLAILCAAVGRIGYVEQPLVQYRQHGANVFGVKSFWYRVARFLYSPKRWRDQISIVYRSILQAGLVRERIRSRGAHPHFESEQQLANYANLLAVPAFKRLGILKACGSYRTMPLENAIFKLLLILQRRDG
jgi:hypothetical protein